MWVSRWIDNKPLRDYLVHEIHLLELQKRVIECWNDTNGWKWNEFQHELHLLLTLKTTKSKGDSSRIVNWIPPDTGWIKVNIDAAMGQHAAAGGLLRDSQGKWMTGFMTKRG